MRAGRRGYGPFIALICLLVAGPLGVSACGTHTHTASPVTTTTLAPDPPDQSAPTTLMPLQSPNVTPSQESQYLTDVMEADSTLATYAQDQGNVALRALLTDGSAFCAFLQRGGGLDNAMVSVAIGARGVESQTHLPSTVATFNTIEAVALLTLCPSEQDLVPTSDRSRIRQLGEALAKEPG